MYEDCALKGPSKLACDISSKTSSPRAQHLKITLETSSNFDSNSFDSKASSLQLSKSSISQVTEPNLSKSKASNLHRTSNSCQLSMKTISDLSFNDSFAKEEIPTQAWRMSEAVTSAKNSFYDENKENHAKLSIHFTSFAVPSRMFCGACEKEVFTVVSFQLVEPGFWDNIENFWYSFRCCDEKIVGRERQLMHCCSKCRKVLAKISAGV